jgi:hypothetical protein
MIAAARGSAFGVEIVAADRPPSVIGMRATTTDDDEFLRVLSHGQESGGRGFGWPEAEQVAFLICSSRCSRVRTECSIQTRSTASYLQWSFGRPRHHRPFG